MDRNQIFRTIVCPEPNFKPSITRKYNLSRPARDFFTPWMGLTTFIEDTFQNRTVQDLFEELSYNKNDLMIFYQGTYLKLGKNEVENLDGYKIDIELKSLPTLYNGHCYLIELLNANQWDERNAFIYLGYRFEKSLLNEFNPLTSRGNTLV